MTDTTNGQTELDLNETPSLIVDDEQETPPIEQTVTKDEGEKVIKRGAPPWVKKELHQKDAWVRVTEAALKRGDIFFHAFAHNAEASTYPDASLFEAGIEVSSAHRLHNVKRAP